MKRCISVLSFVLLLFVGSLASAASNNNKECAPLLPPKRNKPLAAPQLSGENSPSTYKFGPLSQFDFGVMGDEEEAKSTFLYFFAKTISSKKRLPTGEEVDQFIRGAVKRSGFEGEAENAPLDPYVERILKNPSVLVGKNGLFASYDQVVKAMKEAQPSAFGSLQYLIWRQAFLFFRHRLIPPTLEQLATVLKFEDKELLNAIVTQPEFWNEGRRSDLGRHLDFARKRIKTAYARAVRGTDTALANRSRRIRPTLRRMVEVMIITKSNEHYQWRAFNGDYGDFDVYDNAGKKVDRAVTDQMLSRLENQLEAMLGIAPLKEKNPDWVFPMPLLYPGGMDQLHTVTRGEYQPTFTTYEDIVNYPMEYAEAVKSRIMAARGFVVSQVQPGWKIDWDLIQAMREYQKQGYEVLFIPADGSVQDLDPELLKIPNVNILTSSIENKEFLISNFPSMGRKDGVKPFKSDGMFKIGQQIIAPHHTFGAEVIATDENEQNQTQVFLTGTVNLPLVPAVGKAQKAKAIETSKTMKRGFLVVEKVDQGKDHDFGGATNHWHIRPVEWRPAHWTQLKGGVMADNGNIIQVSHDPKTGERLVESRRSKWISVLLFDVHMIVANAHIMKATQEFIGHLVQEGYEVDLVFPDPIDSKAINHHLELKQQNDQALNKMMANGQLNFNREINDAISNVNVILEKFPGVNIIFQYSNHSDEWIDRNMMNAPRWLQLVANGDIIDELRFACRVTGYKPLEYLLIHRREFLEKNHRSGSSRYLDNYNFVSDPSRVRVLALGDKFRVGAATDLEYSVKLQHHGHMGRNGAKGSEKTHRQSAGRSMTGDSHRFGYYGAGSNYWISVGASAFSQPYTRGGYSSWSVALGVVYDNNLMQPFNWDPYTMSFFQESSNGVLGEEFFSDDPLVVTAAMDDDDRRRAIDTEEFFTWFEAQEAWNQQDLDEPLWAE